MKLIAIDPGTFDTALIVYDLDSKEILTRMHCENKKVERWLWENRSRAAHLAIEMIKSYGNVMGDSVIRTCVWIGKFQSAWGGPVTEIPRKTAVSVLCKNVRASDKNVRMALLDRFAAGGSIKAVIGTKGKPGPLYGLTGDLWSALAVAVAYDILRDENKDAIADMLR